MDDGRRRQGMVTNDSGWQRMAMVGLADDDNRRQTVVDDASGWFDKVNEGKKGLVQSEKKVIGKDKIEEEKIRMK